MRLSKEEECVLINAREMSLLWSILADWTNSEDEQIWGEVAPMFAEIVRRWEAAGYIQVYQGEEWPAHEGGTQVTGEKLQDLLRDPSTWQYHEGPPVSTLLPTEKSLELTAP